MSVQRNARALRLCARPSKIGRYAGGAGLTFSRLRRSGELRMTARGVSKDEALRGPLTVRFVIRDLKNGGFIMALKAGDKAPDFKLKAAIGDQQGEFQLSDHKGKTVVLLFYALDFT
ncbi:MAG: redoxin domain-containing protein, partial [Terriglobia bacterium]